MSVFRTVPHTCRTVKCSEPQGVPNPLRNREWRNSDTRPRWDGTLLSGVPYPKPLGHAGRFITGVLEPEQNPFPITQTAGPVLEG